MLDRKLFKWENYNFIMKNPDIISLDVESLKLIVKLYDKYESSQTKLSDGHGPLGIIVSSSGKINKNQLVSSLAYAVGNESPYKNMGSKDREILLRIRRKFQSRLK